MNDNYEQPKPVEIQISETNYSHIFGPKDWKPMFSVGPFLPISSNGEGMLPYKMADGQKSSFVDYSQPLMMI
jgi:hypothetical protein